MALNTSSSFVYRLVYSYFSHSSKALGFILLDTVTLMSLNGKKRLSRSYIVITRQPPSARKNRTSLSLDMQGTNW